MLHRERKWRAGKEIPCSVWHCGGAGNQKSSNRISLSGSASGCVQYVQEITSHLCFHLLGCQMNTAITVCSECSGCIRAIKHWGGRSHGCDLWIQQGQAALPANRYRNHRMREGSPKAEQMPMLCTLSMPSTAPGSEANLCSPV